MGGTDPHLLIFLALGGCTLISLLASGATWHLSRAKKVRLMEDQVVSAVRAQRERADQIETKLGEWQVTITAMLAEAEDFFDRSVKERKRATVALSRQQAETQGNAQGDFAHMGRNEQMDALRAHFANR